MKRRKQYTHRPGMRFDRRSVQGPGAGFLGAEIEVVTITGSVERSMTQTYRSSSAVDESVGPFGTEMETRYLNQKLLGLGTGALGRSAGLVNVTTGSIPSWSNIHLGRSHAFVIPVLSSSDHESQVLNYQRSGTEALETTSVPASASLYFSKERRYSTIVVKKTASFFDTVVPFSGVIVPSLFLAGTGSYVTRVTGANTPALSSSYRYPATIRIDVPTSGRLVDIKVWVELVHLSGTEIAGTQGKFFPLGSLGVALRSPNVRWGHAHPIRNDPAIQSACQDPTFAAFLVGGGLSNNDIWYPPANFYRDTFLLWEGMGICNDGYSGPWDKSSTHNGRFSLYPTWQRDRGMRTIFADGALTPNPRHHYTVISRNSANGVVKKTNPYTHPSGNNWFESPNANGVLSANPTKIPTPVDNSANWAIFEVGVSAFGNSWPWTSDRTVFPATESHQAAGSPPVGWLTGPGGVAATNEWPTTGVNYGPAQIKPLYPLLDGIYQKKVVGDEFPILGSIVKSLVTDGDIPQSSPTSWRGFRPGLRGTEISGTWELLICQSGKTAELNTQTNVDQNCDAYFRQVRLEITYEAGRGSGRVRQDPAVSARRSGPVFMGRISGSAVPGRDDGSGSWDSYISDTYMDAPGDTEIGRTFGVGLLTGSAENGNFALLYRLTGTLADLSGTNPGWLLNNQFGMPAIPLSSASLVEASMEPISSIHPQDILTVRPLLDAAQRLSDAARDAAPPLTRAAYAAELISGTLT